jgi:EAL domain-containing protein (putative c-di-GMP-specific phosphodiesterase class I)
LEESVANVPKVERPSRDKWTFSGDGRDGGLVPGGVAPGSAAQPEARSVRSLKPEDVHSVLQPIVELDSGRCFAAEVLARCRWPELASPLELFKSAETDQCVGRLGRMIRDHAFARPPSLPLFVNLHPHELSSRWLVRPDDPLNFHECDVYLEITESAAFDHFDLVTNTLRELCSRSGAKLAIDDFGAGYSNLKRVVELEPAIVKLDRELVCGIHRSPRQQTLVRHLVELCEDLGARVVAEGIEEVGELRVLRELGVHYGQGFLMARPASFLPEVSWPLTDLPVPAGGLGRASGLPPRRPAR